MAGDPSSFAAWNDHYGFMPWLSIYQEYEMSTKTGRFADTTHGLGPAQKPAPQSTPGSNPREGQDTAWGIDKDDMSDMGPTQKPGRP